MAQTGYTPISLYYSSTASATPTAGNLVSGELAINTADGKLFYKDSSGVVQTLATKDTASGSFTNLAYTGTLTGGTGVVNLGSGQFYKDASGNVGIGTSSPASNSLSIARGSGVGCSIEIAANGATPASTNCFTLSQAGNNEAYVFNRANQPLIFGTNNAERMRIDSSGRLLLGATGTPSSSGVKQVISGGTANYIEFISTSNDGVVIGNTAGNMQFFTFTGALGSESYTERMRIDSSGNVGIGTTNTGSFRLNVADGSSATRMWISNTANAAGGSGIYMQVYNGASVVTDNTIASDNTGNMKFFTGTSSGSERMRIDSSGNVGIGTSSPVAKLDIISGTARMYFSNQSSTAFITAVNTANSAYAPMAINGSEIILKTGDTERIRIDSSGSLLVGKTSLPSASVFGFAVNASSNNFQYLMNSVNTTGSGTQFQFLNPNGIVGYIYTSGSTTAYVTSSDYRLKENIAPMTGALAKVTQLKPVTYNWKSDGSDGEGFIAHELAEVCPQAVGGEKDAVDADGKPVYQGIDTSFLVATLTAAIQEQQAMIEELKAKVAALEAA